MPFTYSVKERHAIWKTNQKTNFNVISRSNNSKVSIMENGGQVVKKSQVGNYRKNIELYKEFEFLMPEIIKIEYFETSKKGVHWEYMVCEKYTGDLHRLGKLTTVFQKGVLEIIKGISELGYIFLDIKPQNMVYKSGVVKVIDINLGLVHHYPELNNNLRIWCNLALFLVHAQAKWIKKGVPFLMNTLFSYTRICSEEITTLQQNKGDSLLRQWMDYQINWYCYSVELFWTVCAKAASGLGLRIQKKKFRESGFKFKRFKVSERLVMKKPDKKVEPKTPEKLPKEKTGNSSKSTVKVNSKRPARDTRGGRQLDGLFR